MRYLIWPVTYYLLGAMAGVLTGLYWPAAPHRTLPPHGCGALQILEQAIPATQTPQLLLIGIMSLMNVFQRPAPQPELIPPMARAGVAARYLGLCAALAAGTTFCRLLLDSH